MPTHEQHRDCFLVCLLMGCAVLGCRESPPVQPPAAALPSADEILGRMLRVYREATSYRDHGVVRLKYRQGGQWFQDEASLEVTWRRPDRLLLRAYQLTMVSDGRQLQAIVADSASGDLDGQVLTRPTPPQLPVDKLYEDDVVRNVVASGLGGPPVQLELLLTETPLPYVFASNARRDLIDEASVGACDCYRVRVSLPEGVLVFWIDRENYRLLRLEYPANRLAEQMSSASDCSEVSLLADFRNARVDAPIEDSDFTLPLPEQAKLVRKFVLPPPPLPSDLLGRASGDFAFTDLQGERLTRAALLGRIAVLVWFNNHAASRNSLEQLASVQADFADEARLALYAVCTEPTSLGNEQLQALTRQWGVGLPVVRDLKAFGRDVFRVPWAPTLVVLDQQGVVQLFEVGANPNLSRNLSQVVRQLLQGENVAAQVLERVAEERRAYQQSLAESALPRGASTAVP